MTTSTPSNTSKSEPTAPTGWLARRPWLWVVFAFVMLLSAWSALFYVAMKNQPETVPLVNLSAAPAA